MNFNEKFRQYYEPLLKENNRYLDSHDLEFNIFASFVNKVSYDDEDEHDIVNLDQNIVKIDEFRILILLHFLAKLTSKRVTVYVCNATTFNEMCNLFNFDENCLRIKSLDADDEDFKQILKNSKYAIAKENYTLINLRQIINDHGLLNYDPNISFCNIDFEKNIISSIKNLNDFMINQIEGESKILLHVCSNSQFVSQQKSAIMSKIFTFNGEISENKYLVVSQVKSDVTNINDYFKLKEKYFRETTAQRMSTSFEMCEDNIKLLTLCSITFDLLKVNHNSDIKLQTANFINEHDSAFLLYNCARISTILQKFKYLVNQGVYPPLPEIENIDFESLLKHELEKRLCNDYIFSYYTYLDDLKSNLIGAKQLSIKLNIHKLCRFLFEFSKTFSSYYSKVKVLEDPKFSHLLSTMFARIYLMKAIYNTLKYLLNLFNIQTPERI